MQFGCISRGQAHRSARLGAERQIGPQASVDVGDDGIDARGGQLLALCQITLWDPAQAVIEENPAVAGRDHREIFLEQCQKLPVREGPFGSGERARRLKGKRIARAPFAFAILIDGEIMARTKYCFGRSV